MHGPEHVTGVKWFGRARSLLRGPVAAVAG